MEAIEALGENLLVKSLSPAMREVEEIIAEVAPTDLPVLIVGESGSGKEAIAQQIHHLSSRSRSPFVKLVSATLTIQHAEKIASFDPSSFLVESLLGAGTIFLDEVSDLELTVQPRLLHFLPDGAVRQGDQPPARQNGGAHPPLPLAARIISSTIRNLEEEIHQGRFREELYYRLNGVCLHLPPLRRRREDIPLLVEFFLTKYTQLLGRSKPELNSRTAAQLTNFPWPGNIRQLENTIKKIVALGDVKQALRDFDGNGSDNGHHNNESEQPSLKQAARAASRQAERELILKALERTRWNRKKAARELRISYKALLYKLKQIGLDLPADGEGI